MSDRNDINRRQANGGGSSNKSSPASHYQIPNEPGKSTALILAGVMHVLLFLFLWVGIHWQSKTPIGVDAEIWDVTTREAAPVPVVVTPPPPTPVVQENPEPPKPSAKEVEEEHEVEIALERAKEKKLAEKKQLEEQQRQADLQKEQEKEQEKELKKQEAAKIAEQKKADALAQKQRDDNLKRLTSQVAGSGGTGDAVKSTGNNRADSNYASRIAAKIRSNTIYAGTDNPSVDFSFDLFLDGSMRGQPRMTRSSGNPVFDNAVAAAIIKSAPYPADKTGTIPKNITITLTAKEKAE